ILPYIDGQIGLFNDLQKRIGRKTVGKTLLKQVPVIFKAYDLLEYQSTDIRKSSYKKRRLLLEELVLNTAAPVLHLSEQLAFNSWEEVKAERELSRDKRSEGLMLKKKDAEYQFGRKKGDW